MRLESVNRSLPRPVTLGGREHVTGIAKEPVTGPVAVGPDGLDGDGVANTKDHGGPDQAVYLYSLDDYAWWTATADLATRPGLFGENLTVDQLVSAEAEVGDRLRVGEVTFEITGSRIPCSTLSGRVGDGGFARTFAAAQRPGAYLRVLTSGTIAAGDPITFEQRGSGVTLAECMGAYYDPSTGQDDIRRMLAAPVARRFRSILEGRLDRAEHA